MEEKKKPMINGAGHLVFGGADCVELAAEFGTPLYLYDVQTIRAMMRVFRDAMQSCYGNGQVLYASKAFSCMSVYELARQEGLGVDVVSGGELYTAMQVGFPAEKIYFHGNNKLPSEIAYALDCGVGCIVVDAESEAELLEREAAKRGIRQSVLLRINPGVEAHTHAYVQTATPDSKFGFSVADGSAARVSDLILSKPHLQLAGYHCHIGSQIFEEKSFVVAAEKAVAFLAERKKKCGYEAEILNLGGGFGIWYADGDREMGAEEYRGYIAALAAAVRASCAEHGLKEPCLVIEPGRAIVGEAGITLYTVGAIKQIKGVRTYLTVDGGMFENPRYALYRSKYTALLCNRAGETPTERYAIAGKCCESGDLIGVDFALPKVRTGDLIAVLSTGAYHYSMASNYNRNLVPPVVFVQDGRTEYAVKPQTYADLVRNDVLCWLLK